jgi:hypothetical protein
VKLTLKRFVVLLFVVSFFFIFKSQFSVYGSSEKYVINTSDLFTLSGSIVKIIDDDTLYEYEHYSKFYLLLKDIEYGSSQTPTSLLSRYGIPYTASIAYTNRIQVRATWEYDNFVIAGEYHGGFTEEYEIKRISIEYVQTTYQYLSAGNHRALFMSACPPGWTFKHFFSPYNENVVCSVNSSGSKWVSSGITPSPNIIKGEYFIRYFDTNQAIYGYHTSYQPKFSFSYKSGSSMTLIDDDKLLIKKNNKADFMINRDFHYDRNQFNFVFDSVVYISPEEVSLFNYFHMLGNYNGDTSNLNNIKIIADNHSSSGYIDDITLMFENATSEAIYKASGTQFVLVTEPLVMGTFNFSSDTEAHYRFDVYPYLIWGNLNTDRSTIRERFIWDDNATKVYLGLANLLVTFRGNSLYYHEHAMISTQLKSSGFLTPIDVLNRIENQIVWNFGGYSGTQSPPSACGDIGQPPCVVINGGENDNE